MKHKSQLFAMFLLLFIGLCVPASLSQIVIPDSIPHCSVILANDSINFDFTEYSFDVYLLNTGTIHWELASLQLGLQFNNLIKHGPTIATWDAGLSDPSIVAAGMTPGSINLTLVIGNTGVMRYAARLPIGGPGTGPIISSIAPGTKFGRIRLFCAAKFIENSYADLTFNSVGAPVYSTRPSAYVANDQGGFTKVDISSNCTFVNNLSNPNLNDSWGQLPGLNVMFPNGGEKWQEGSSHDIIWKYTSVWNIKIDYTTDNGISWTAVIASTPASLGSYLWTIPNTPSSQCKVRIIDVDGWAGQSSSNVFTIEPIPTYTASLCNDVQTALNVYEFDVYLRRTGTAEFELGSAQLGLKYNSALLNGGTLTASWVPGSSDASLETSGQVNTDFNTATTGVIKVAPKSPSGGPGTGAIISPVFPGTKVGRMRLTNSLTFAVEKPDITWNFNTTLYPTEITANLGGTITDITAPANHKYCDGSSSTWGNPTCPVELSSFSSVPNGRTIQLNWETKTEKNSDKFNIERKTINSDWGTIATIKAAVLSNSPKQYLYTDKNLQAGKYEYRLKMIDNDGTFEYSKVIETEISKPKNFELSQNFPNPWNPSTKINYTLPSDSKVTLEVYNISGERIAQLVNEEQSAGYYSLDFNASKLSSGVYFYKITAVDKATGNNFSSIKKMILLK